MSEKKKKRIITGTTKVVGIIGDPIEHTLSPAMHNAAFEALGLDYVYVPFQVRADEPGGLKKAIEAVTAMNLAGLNVTIPHKEEALELLDPKDVDDEARTIGAVNTIVNRNGRLKGYNTDAFGYFASITNECEFDPEGKKVVIIGAGGAARAILFAILSLRAKSIVVANRTYARAEKLVDEFSDIAKSKKIGFAATAFDDIDRYMHDADLLVNTTSVGMMDEGELGLPLDMLPKHAIVSDIVYRPLETKLLKQAKTWGLKTHGGLGMLVYQGVRAFELWTGSKAPIEVMREAALKELGYK